MHPIQYFLRLFFGAGLITASFFIKTVDSIEKCINIVSEEGAKLLFVGENLKTLLISCIGTILVAFGAFFFVIGLCGLFSKTVVMLKNKSIPCVILNIYPKAILFGKMQVRECIVAYHKNGKFKESKMLLSEKKHSELTPGEYRMLKLFFKESSITDIFDDSEITKEHKDLLKQYFNKHGNKQYSHAQTIVLEKSDSHLKID